MLDGDKPSSDTSALSRSIGLALVVLIVIGIGLYVAHDRSSLHWANRQWWESFLAWIL